MAARCPKGVLNSTSSLLKTRTASLRGYAINNITNTTNLTHQRPIIRAIADSKKAKDPASAPTIHAATPKHQHQHQHPQPCKCPDCKWFPFHKPQGSKFPPLLPLLSDATRGKLSRFVEDVIVYTPVISGNPLEPPTNFALYYHLPGPRSMPLHERAALLNESSRSTDAATTAEDDEEGKKGKGAGQDDDDDDHNDDSNSTGGNNKKKNKNEKKKNDQDAPEDKDNKGEEDYEIGALRTDRDPWNERIPLEGRGWTFWL